MDHDGSNIGLGVADSSRLSDRAAIADVLAHYCVCLDEYDIDSCCAVFTDDCTTDYGPGRGGVVHGRARRPGPESPAARRPSGGRTTSSASR